MNDLSSDEKIDGLLRQCAKLLTDQSTSFYAVNMSNIHTITNENFKNNPSVEQLDNLDHERFRFLETIGQGGMGRVYKAFDKVLFRTVAVKQVKIASAEALERFQIEARSCASLDHPHIVSVYDFQNINDIPCIIMQHIEGMSLAKLLSQKQLSINEVYLIFIQILDAIEHAHDKGIIHRDLKPGNILLDNNGKAFITDFGIAKAMDHETNFAKAEEIIGTPTYMSPEQAKAEKLDVRSDLYSLGAILYEMLTSRPVFTGVNPFTLIHQVVNSVPIPPRNLNHSLSIAWENFCLKALEKDKEKRFASAQEMKSALQQIMKEKSSTSKKKKTLHIIQNVFIYTVLLCSIFFLSVNIWNNTQRKKSTPQANKTDKTNKEQPLTVIPASELKIYENNEHRQNRYNKTKVFTRFMEKHDVNQDGKLDIIEWPFASKNFYELDTDSDQFLDGKEVRRKIFHYIKFQRKKAEHAKTRLLIDYFNKLDQNNDRKITIEEFPHHRMFPNVDTNKDCLISKEEFKNFFEQNFSKILEKK